MAAAGARSTKCVPTSAASLRPARPTATRPVGGAGSNDVSEEVTSWNARSAFLDGLHDDLDAAVVRAAGGRGVVRYGAALPHAGRRNDLVRHPARDQVVAHRLRAPLRQLHVRR